jgi:glycosyltransferase involved in cell wall biosynthesis
VSSSQSEMLMPTAADTETMDVSIVIPCLNEADTLGRCVDSARAALAIAGVDGEVVVADNGSTDGSREIAVRHGARLVPVAERGYGAALLGGIAAARGRWVLMADGDDSYDFAELPRFLPDLRDGVDLVQGCRLPSGGGTVMPGAMPTLHRWWGNPMFSWMARLWFRAPIHDVHCGMRAFRRELVQELDLRCTGMEFASEMIIKASLQRVRMTEVPVTLRPDGRIGRRPHLRTFRDGWRHLRFYLLMSPRWTFLLPGLLLVFLGVLGYGLSLPAARVGQVGLDVHTLLVASLCLMLGAQVLIFAVFTRVFAVTRGLMPPNAKLESLSENVSLERGLVAGGIGVAFGLALILVAVLEWRATGYGALDPRHTMRWVIPGVTAMVVGAQVVFGSFFFSILRLHQR